MFVPLTHTGVKGWMFNLVCPGNAMSATHERLLLLKSATVNRNLGFDEVCNEKHVYIGYNNEQGWFGVSKGELEKLPLKPYVRYYSIAQEPEIQELFFKSYNVTPHWINCNFSWGTLDYTTGQWSGGVGLIQRDEVDYALHGYAGTYPRSKVAAFSPGTSYMPFHWLTRYPLKQTPLWNLTGLFTKGYNSQMSKLKLISFSNKKSMSKMHICEFFFQFVWTLTFCSILLVSVAFIISSRIYKNMYPKMKLCSNEVVLIPFRLVIRKNDQNDHEMQ